MKFYDFRQIIFNAFKNTTYPVCVGLGHEIGHVVDVYKRTYSHGLSSVLSRFPNSTEEFAAGFENQIRSGLWSEPLLLH
jgi:hypothetical protein